MDERREALTRRELEVLTFVARGLGDKEIAQRLGLARTTVSNHITIILLKLQAANRSEAAAIAVERGWIHHDAPPGE